MRRILQIALLIVLAAASAGAQRTLPTIVIQNVTVIDGTGAAPRTGQTVLVEKGQIKSIGSKLELPKDAQVVDGSGKYLVPGLWDARVHLTASPGNRLTRNEAGLEERIAALHAMLRSGVTTARVTQSALDDQTVWQRWSKEFLVAAPNIVTGGPVFTGVNGQPTGEYPALAEHVRKRETREVKDGEEATKAAREVAHNPVETFEIAYDAGPSIDPSDRLPDDLLATIIKEAHGHDLKAFVWVGHNEEAKKALMAGADVIEGVSDEALSDDVIALMKQKGAAYLPALSEQGDLGRLLDGEQMAAFLKESMVQRSVSPVLLRSFENSGGIVPYLRGILGAPRRVPPESLPPEEQAAALAALNASNQPQSNGTSGQPAKGDGENTRPAVDKQSAAPQPEKLPANLVSTLGELLKRQQKRAQQNALRAHAAGVEVILGTGAGNLLDFFGVSVHREMQLLVEGGFTPMQALTIATRNTARALGRTDVGTVEAGKGADLVLLSADPLADIHNTTKIDAVFKQGRKVNLEQIDSY
jgi:imidazolonepropionase-like amidohydrolase